MKRRFFILALALSIVTLLPGANLAQNANGNHDTYQFLAFDPDVATAPDGSTVTLAGSGIFKAGPNKSADGGGEYEIRSPDGSFVASGSWTVTGILGFVDYGDSTPQEPAFLHGGQLKLEVSLAGYDDGVLTITCAHFGSPPNGKDEGIKLVLGQGGNFTESTEGDTVFITQ